MKDYVIIVSCGSAGFGLVTNVETLSEKKKKERKRKTTNCKAKNDGWLKCQRLCLSNMDWLQPEVNLELKWN